MIGTLMILKNATLLIGVCILLFVGNAQAATLTVDTTADSGVGSLRQAIIDAISGGGANTITFNIPITDPGYNGSEYRFTINLLSPLPDLPTPLLIDNDQPHFITVRANDAFRIFYLPNSAAVTINKLTISNGIHPLGGAIFLGDSSTLNLNRCTVSGNSGGDGGAIYMNDSTTLNIDSCTISGNTASNDGGGIFIGASGTVNATSNTFDGNSASGSGGAIYNSATITLTNNTITSNSAVNAGGGIYNAATATLNNNLVAFNSADAGVDLFGGGFTGTYNLIMNADGSAGLIDPTNQNGTTGFEIDPMIGILQNNGGGTFTHALMTDSPAIDKGNSPGIGTDQCAHPRVVDNMLIPNGGNGADIGAFEVQLAPTSIDVSIGGRVLLSLGGRGAFGAIVYLTDLNGDIRSARTNGFGYYSFENVATGQTYMLNVTHKKYQFDAQAVSVVGEMSDLNFIAVDGGLR